MAESPRILTLEHIWERCMMGKVITLAEYKRLGWMQRGIFSSRSSIGI